MPLDPNADPTILHVADIDDPFAPLPRSRLMMNVTDDRERIDALLDKLIHLYYTDARKSLAPKACVGAAMKAGALTLE